MTITLTQHLIAAAFLCALAMTATIAYAADALPSWNDGATKKSIVEFVAKVTKEGRSDCVPSAERIAVFDNDVPPWREQQGFPLSIPLVGCSVEIDANMEVPTAHRV